MTDQGFRMPKLRVVALLFCVSVLSGCAYLRAAIGMGPIKPKVHLTELSVVGFDLVTLRLRVGLRIDNPNDFPLTFSKLKYRLVAGGLEVAEGDYKERTTIAAEKRTQISLPVSVHAARALELVRRLTHEKKDMEATVTATCDFATPFGDMEVSFEEKRPLGKLAGLP